MSFARFLHSGALENPQPKSSDTSAKENESPRGTGHLNKNSKPIYQEGRTNLGGSLNRRSGRIRWTATPEVRLCHDGARTDAMFLRARKPAAYCDHCLASNLRLATRLEAQRTTLVLSKMPLFVRMTRRCSQCATTSKSVIRSVGV